MTKVWIIRLGVWWLWYYPYIVSTTSTSNIHSLHIHVSRKRGDIKSHSSVPLSVCLSVCHKNFNLGHNFCTITDRALIIGMCVPCDKTFLVVPCRDLDGNLWPFSRSNSLPSGGSQFSEFACFTSFRYRNVLVNDTNVPEIEASVLWQGCRALTDSTHILNALCY